MIDVNEAKAIAEKYLQTLSGDDISIGINTMEEFEEGILFSFQSKEYLETRNFSYFLVGNQPFIVDRVDGTIFHKPNKVLDKEDLIDLFRTEKGYSPAGARLSNPDQK